MPKIVSFAKPYFSKEDIDEITQGIRRVLRSGWLTSGPKVRELEESFIKLLRFPYAIAVNSGTAALHSILLALGIGNDDEVIVPSNTFAATANVALYVGAKPVFAECDPETFNISPDDVQNKISKKSKVIIPVHIAGNPCDMYELNELAHDNGLVIVEDCAHALGAKYQGSYCGTLGTAGAFSFYPTKIVTAGEGGMVTTDNREIADKIKLIRNHGRAGYGPLEITELGYNFRLTDIHAVIGLTQLKHLNEYIRQRNTLAGIYNQELAKIKWIQPQHIRDKNGSSYYAYIIKLSEDSPISRDEFMEELRVRNVMTSVLYHPTHLQPLYVRLFGYNKGLLPVTEELGKRSFALPLFNGMSIEDARYVLAAIKDIVEARGK